MYLSIRGAFVRNLAAAVVNGAITLGILLIAPLGLASVIVNTALVVVSTFVVCTLGDVLTIWLLNANPSPRFSRQRSRDYRSLEYSDRPIEPERYEE